MVFLSVAWGIYGIGDTVTFGRIGKRMVIHFIGAAFLIGTFCVPLAIPFFSLNLIWEGSGTTQLSNLFQMILGFIPTDIVTPFQNGNSLQIILLGIAVVIISPMVNIVINIIKFFTGSFDPINLNLQTYLPCICFLLTFFSS